MQKFIKENWFRLAILILFLLVSLSVAYYFVYIPLKDKKDIEINLQKKIAEEERYHKAEWEYQECLDKIARLRDSLKYPETPPVNKQEIKNYCDKNKKKIIDYDTCYWEKVSKCKIMDLSCLASVIKDCQDADREAMQNHFDNSMCESTRETELINQLKEEPKYKKSIEEYENNNFFLQWEKANKPNLNKERKNWRWEFGFMQWMMENHKDFCNEFDIDSINYLLSQGTHGNGQEPPKIINNSVKNDRAYTNNLDDQDKIKNVRNDVENLQNQLEEYKNKADEQAKELKKQKNYQECIDLRSEPNGYIEPRNEQFCKNMYL